MPSQREKNNLGRKQRILPVGLVPEGPPYLLHGRLEDRRLLHLAIAQLLLCSQRTILPCALSCKLVVLWRRRVQQHTVFVRHPSMRLEQPAAVRLQSRSRISQRLRAAPSERRWSPIWTLDRGGYAHATTWLINRKPCPASRVCPMAVRNCSSTHSKAAGKECRRLCLDNDRRKRLTPLLGATMPAQHQNRTPAASELKRIFVAICDRKLGKRLPLPAPPRKHTAARLRCIAGGLMLVGYVQV